MHALFICYLFSIKVTDWNTKSEGKSQNWWDQFVDGLRIDILEDICHQILDLYSTQQAAKGAPTPTTPTSSTNNPSNNSSTPSKKVNDFHMVFFLLEHFDDIIKMIITHSI